MCRCQYRAHWVVVVQRERRVHVSQSSVIQSPSNRPSTVCSLHPPVHPAAWTTIGCTLWLRELTADHSHLPDSLYITDSSRAAEATATPLDTQPPNRTDACSSCRSLPQTNHTLECLLSRVGADAAQVEAIIASPLCSPRVECVARCQKQIWCAVVQQAQEIW